jgi:DNA-binding response OmpR family regulator
MIDFMCFFNLESKAEIMADKKILIADFDKKNLEHLASIFASTNIEVFVAADGQEAYDIFQSEKPDLLLLEPMLPKLHGFDLIKKIRKELGKETPIVVLTGIYKGSRHKSEALNALGLSDYIEKPFNSEQLKKKVVNLIYIEDPIDEDLPDPDSVFETLVEMAGEIEDASLKK